MRGWLISFFEYKFSVELCNLSSISRAILPVFSQKVFCMKYCTKLKWSHYVEITRGHKKDRLRELYFFSFPETYFFEHINTMKMLSALNVPGSNVAKETS